MNNTELIALLRNDKNMHLDELDALLNAAADALEAAQPAPQVPMTEEEALAAMGAAMSMSDADWDSLTFRQKTMCITRVIEIFHKIGVKP